MAWLAAHRLSSTGKACSSTIPRGWPTRAAKQFNLLGPPLVPSPSVAYQAMVAPFHPLNIQVSLVLPILHQGGYPAQDSLNGAQSWWPDFGDRQAETGDYAPCIEQRQQRWLSGSRPWSQQVSGHGVRLEAGTTVVTGVSLPWEPAYCVAGPAQYAFPGPASGITYTP